MTLKTRKPVPHHRRPAIRKKINADTLSRLVREILGILLAGLIIASTLWTSVFGMAADLSAGPEMHQGGRAHGE